MGQQSTKAHYSTKDWPERIQLTVDQEIVKYKPLVEKDKIILPPLHIKLGFFKIVGKVLHKERKQ